MSDAVFFDLVIIVLYMGECLVKFPMRGAVFQRGWSKWRKGGSLVLRHGSLQQITLGSLFPPLGATIVCPVFPVQTNPKVRANRISEIGIRDRMREFTASSMKLSLACNVLWTTIASIMLLMPQDRWNRGYWPWMAGAIIAETWLIVLLFRGVHRALYPHRSDQRFIISVSMALYPLTAIRAIDHLSRDLLLRFHPLAVAHALASRCEFTEMASASYRAARHPHPAAYPSAHAASLEAETLAGIIRNAGIDPEEFLLEPEPHAADCKAWCPRCREQFILNSESCPDCRIPLHIFSR